MKLLIFIAAFSMSALAANKNTVTYFSCNIREDGHNVSVKFAVKDYDSIKNKGELVSYPGSNEDDGLIFVTPKSIGKFYPRMHNLNGQGGDLRIARSGDLHLFGDGDGYQFTDLVIWNDNDDSDELEGYVRDYGSAYGDAETFKQFIKCRRSSKVL